MTSFLLQIRGGWVDAVNSEEIWQVGIRLWMDGSVPDNSGTFPALTIAPEENSFDTTNGTVQSNWTLASLLNLEDYMDDIDQAVLSWQAAISAWSNKCTITGARLYPIDGDGKVVQITSGAAVATLTYNSAQAGPSTAPQMPLEVAAVVSWQTYKNTPKGRGRIYVPAPTRDALGTAGRWGTDFIDDLGAATTTLLTDIAVESVSPTQLHARPVVTGPSDWDLYSVIRRVRVGDVPDSQRRRRNRLSETYAITDVTYG